MSRESQHILTLEVEGMTCASCVARVEKALKKLDGVSSANVNLANEKVTIEYNENATNLDALAASVSEAGYVLVRPRQTDVIENQKVAVRGEESRHEQAYRQLKREFIISLALTVPVIGGSMISMTDWFMRWNPLSLDDLNRLLLIATTAVVMISGKRFYKSAWEQAKHLTADMNTLIAVGTAVAYGYSVVVVLFPHWLNLSPRTNDVYFDTAATIITLVLFGRMLESRAKSKTTDAIRKLMDLRPKIATVVRDGVETTLAVNEIGVGESIIVRPGEQIPTDGVITKGQTTIDESMVTGESLPVDRKAGQKVIGGTMNKNGAVVFRATAVGKGTMVAQIIQLVEQAQGSKAPVQALVDRVAAYFVPAVITIAVATFVLWYFAGGVGFTSAMTNFIAVLIIACPCALGLATPTAIIVGTGRGASMGILLKNAETLERAQKIQTIVLDKTGTLTIGKPAVAEMITFNGINEKELMRIAGSAEKKSEHPLGKAIVTYAISSGVPLADVDSFQSHSGFGISCDIEGKVVLIGKEEFLRTSGIDISSATAAIARTSKEGKTTVLVAIDNHIAGAFALADSLHASSREAVEQLKGMGIEVVMMTGDNKETATDVAKQVGIEQVISEVLPQDKAARISEIQSTGKTVAMVGDGINDAPALAQADVGIAMGSGTDIAMETADVTLMKSDLTDVVRAIRLSKQTIRLVKQNLFWAFIYNVIGIPLAAIGLLHPVIAAGAMAFSSVSVVSNALRLKWVKL